MSVSGLHSDLGACPVRPCHPHVVGSGVSVHVCACARVCMHAHECVVCAGEHAVCMCVVSVRERVHVSVCVCSGKLIVFCSLAAFPTSPWRNIGPCGRAPALATVTVIK